MASPQPSQTSDPESLFVSALPVIDRIVAILGRRHALDQNDLEEFASWARERIIDRDYSVLRQFGGRSSLATYLSVVLANLYKDYRNSRWGRWRPSAATRRLGPLAIRLEVLLYRDGYPVHQAIEVLKARGFAEAELQSLVRRIPPRSAPSEVPLELALESVEAAQDGYREVQNAEAGSASERTEQAVAQVLASLPPEDRVIVRMRFWDDFTIAEIARALQLPQKPLYRRLEAIQAKLRLDLMRLGIDRDRVADVLAHAGES